MKKIVFATNNPNKLKEIKLLTKNQFEILSLEDIGCSEELSETHDTIVENAFEKANYIFRKYKTNCFAEDTGLEITALNGAPGVFSARYAGEQKSADDNIQLVLKKMQGIKNRSAQFKTVICLILNGKEKYFTGIIKGKITEKPRENKGFGYDPIFQPDGSELTFAEINLAEKNKISHRALAMKQLLFFLKAI